MQFEVFTIGGGRFHYNFLNAVAAICQSAQFGYAINSVLLVGLMWTILTIAFKPGHWDATKTWIGVVFLVVFAAIQMKATVKITDRLNPIGSSGYIVANVPMGVAAFAGITSQFGDEMTRLMESNLTDIDAPKLHEHGFMFGVRLLGNATRMEVKDAVFSENLSNYIRNCLFYDILLGRKNIDDLKIAGDPWTYMTSNASVARMFVISSRDRSGTVTSTIKTCAAGVADLNRQWTAELPAATRRLALLSRPDDLRVDARAPGTGGAWNEGRVRVVMGHVTNELGSFHRYLIGASRSSADILKRQMTINALIRAPLDWNAEMGNSAAVQNYIDARLALQTRQSYKGIWRQAEEWVPNLKAVFQGLYYAMAPVMLLLALTPMGVGILRNYLFGFVWIESWGPLYAIINYFVNSKAQNEMMSLVKAAGGSAGDIQLVAQAGIQAVEADISVMAGQLAMMVMFISIAMVAGVGRYAYLASAALAVPQEAIASTTAESATGNMSIGNTSHNTHAFHRESGFTHAISPSWDSGYSSARTDEGGMAFETPGGKQGLHHQPGQTTLASGINYGGQINEAHSTAIEIAQTKAATARSDLQDASNATTSSFDSFAKTLTDDNTLASSFGTSQRDSINTNVNTVLAYMNEHGIGKELSDDQKLAAALSVGVGAPKSMPIISADGKISYDIGASDRLTHGEREQITQNTRISEALDNILSAELSQSSAHRFGETDSFGAGFDARLSEMRNFSETEARELSETQRLQDSLSQVKSRGGGVNTDYNQAFYGWFHENNIGPSSMLQPETVEEHQQLAKLQQRFLHEEVLPKEFGIQVKPDLKGQYQAEAAALKDQADIAGTHATNQTHVPSGDYISDDMVRGKDQLRQDSDTVHSIVADGQMETGQQVHQHQQTIENKVEDKQDQTKVGRVARSAKEDIYDDVIQLGKEAWDHATTHGISPDPTYDTTGMPLSRQGSPAGQSQPSKDGSSTTDSLDSNIAAAKPQPPDRSSSAPAVSDQPNIPDRQGEAPVHDPNNQAIDGNIDDYENPPRTDLGQRESSNKPDDNRREPDHKVPSIRGGRSLPQRGSKDEGWE